MEYKTENGDTVYGFTQSKKNADEIIMQQKKTNIRLTMLIALMFLFFLILAYVLYRIESGDIIANIVARCIC